MAIIKEHNVETGEIVERPMTASELAEWQELQKKLELDTQVKLNAAAKKAAAEAKLAALGLTPDDLAALGL